MKQAILITAYKNFDHLKDLINFFNEDFNIYIHIDKKTKHTNKKIEEIRLLKNVSFISNKYKTNWGGHNHLRCYLLLAEEALKNNNNAYFHLISGQDYPTKNIFQFKKIIKNQLTNDNLNYLEYFEIPSTLWETENGGFDRIDYFNLFDLFDEKRNGKLLWNLLRLQRKIGKIMGVKRSFSSKINKLYGGSTWWSLSRETLQYVINYTKKEKYLINRMKYTFCPEELYFQTVIMNSDYSKKVINNNLRYMDWSYSRVGKYSSSPAVLNLSDLIHIERSFYLFARKFESSISDDLKSALLK